MAINNLQTDSETPQEVPKVNKNPYKITLSRVVHLNLVDFNFTNCVDFMCRLHDFLLRKHIVI